METNESAQNSDSSSAPAEVAAGIPISAGPIIPPRARPEPPDRKRRNGLADWLLIGACVLGAAYGLQATGRRAAAEFLVLDGSPDRLATATRINSGNALAWERLARTGADRTEALRRIVALRPGDGAPRIDLALELETQQDFSGAEKALQEAVAVDSGFAPRWALANFYLRHGREDEFWTSIRAAMAADPSKTAMAAALCWRAFDEPSLILERGLPDAPEAMRVYFRYLIAEKKLAALGPVWERFEAHVEAGDMPAMSALLEGLLTAGDVDFAVDVWNTLIARNLLDYRMLSLPDGPYLTNTTFDRRVSGMGFDWSAPRATGVSRVQRLSEGAEKAIEVRLSGGQEEYTLLLTQIAPAPDDEDFVFSYEYATQQLPFLTGMGWRILDHLSEEVLAESGSIEAAEDYWNNGEIRFHTPPGTRLLRFELHYQRAEGTDRYRGRYVLRTVALTKASAQVAPESGSPE